MAKVSQQYIEGIKEGRKLLEWWERDGFDVPALLARNLETLQRLRDKTAPLAESRFLIDFYDGEIDFYRNQLAKR